LSPNGRTQACERYPLPGGRRLADRMAAVKSLRHFAIAAVNCGLLVSIPRMLKIGPAPEVFGAGRLTPFSRMHPANAVSA
jgi:hypothetical protein